MKIFAALLIALLPSTVWAQALTGLSVFDTSPFACNGPMPAMFWNNPLKKTILIKKVDTWMGMNYDVKADFWATVYHNGTSIVSPVGWDHYANPSGQHNVQRDFAPGYFRILAADFLSLGYGCNRTDGNTTEAVAHIGFTIWYSTE